MNDYDQLAKLARQSITIMAAPTLTMLALALVLTVLGQPIISAALIGGAIGWLAFTTLMSLHFMKE
ncbi:hypothetical protein [Arachnia propionica]|uniref:hypothetical protein n=1 Tax=Arachnia propionica TaxID=1750 RepID=UPI003C6F7F72